MRACKVEVKLNKEQEQLYKLNISAQRIVWNLFIEENNKSDKYINNYEFSKWFNNTFYKEKEEMLWMKQASTKTLRHTIDLCHATYVKAMKNKKGFPKKKKVKNFNEGYYFVRNSKTQPIQIERHKIKVPKFGWIALKEKGYLPQNNAISGTLTKRANRYFISVVTDENLAPTSNPNYSEGIGIDLGIKEFMTCSNGVIFKNINKTSKVKKLEKKLKREQRALSRKYEVHKKDKTLTWKNIEKNKLRIQKVNYKLECVRNAYVNKCIDILIEQNPKFITLEDLNVSGMRKNKHLAKAISDSKLYYTKQVLIQKCNKHNIEVREVGRFYPSSKTCSHCGEIKKDLKLKDRTYKCSSCGLELDRDYNASINLKNNKNYKILTTVGLTESNDCGQYKNLLVPSRESILEETVKSQFVLQKYLDNKRNIQYNKYCNILQV